MTKCDYCGEKIDLLSVKYTWLDKKEDLAIHDKCLKEWSKILPDKLKKLEKLSQIDVKTLSQNDVNKIVDNIVKNIHKDALYLRFYKPDRPTMDVAMRWLEDHIEDIEKDENYFDKEETLKSLDNIFKRLK